MHIRRLLSQADGTWPQALPSDLDGPDTLVLAFAAAGTDAVQAPLAALAAAFPRSVLVGCSTAGEIAGDQVHDDRVSVAIARFEHTRLRRAAAQLERAEDSGEAGARLAAQLLEPSDGEALRAVFVLSDGLQVNGTLLTDGLRRALPADVAITGGLAGDGARFGRTWILDGGTPAAGRVCAVGLYGRRLQVGHGCEAGWSDFGPERRITRARGNVLYELDGRPALDLYKTYLGDRAAGLPGTALLFPLAVRREGQDGSVIRTVLGTDDAERSMTFAGDIPEGGIARLMRASNDRLIDSADAAGRHAMAGLAADAACLVISVSCVGRRLVLGQRTEEEVETVLGCMPPGSAHVGFYSYGEIAPAHPGSGSDLHNQTMTVTVYGES